MKRICIIAISLLLMAWSGFLHTNLLAQSNQPNIIMILTDDQGSIDLNCYGAKDLYTPNMDRIATEGTRFTQFYSAASDCSPSRAAMLTGKTNLRAGFEKEAHAQDEFGLNAKANRMFWVK